METCGGLFNDALVDEATSLEVEVMYPAKLAFLDELDIHHTLQYVYGIFTRRRCFFQGKNLIVDNTKAK